VPTLLAVPNLSEGRDPATLDALTRAFASHGAARLLDLHADPDHHRAVFTLAAAQRDLTAAVLAGARIAIERIDVMHGPRARARGEHPHVGALDVAPVVYLDAGRRGAACAEALVLAHEIGELGVPVLLYGELAQGCTRAELRRGGVDALAERLHTGELRPDFGPPRLHPTAGATLVAAREPLVAFNLELAGPATLADAQRIAALVREGGAEGLPGLRAIGAELGSGAVAQVSTNVERPLQTPLRAVLEAVRRHAPVARAELVGLAPRAALEGFPGDVPWSGGDPAARTLENALGF
jgi:glutamate formiminotransferase/glutamate formiminotransferase/formiminotetrahydrofolate cyclodeaminase